MMGIYQQSMWNLLIIDYHICVLKTDLIGTEYTWMHVNHRVRGDKKGGEIRKVLYRIRSSSYTAPSHENLN